MGRWEGGEDGKVGKGGEERWGGGRGAAAPLPPVGAGPGRTGWAWSGWSLGVTRLLCDPGSVSSLLCVSISSSVKRG